MKTMMFIVALMLSAWAFSAAESETAKGAKKDMESFKQEMSVKLDSIEKQIAELKEEAQEKGGEAKQRTVRELETARDNVKAKMAKLSENSKDTWANMKKGIADAMESLNARVQKALKE